MPDAYVEGMIAPIFAWFERRLDPYPQIEAGPPPSGTLAFAWHYTKPGWPIVAGVALLSAIVAVVDVSLFAFMGRFVDWLTAQDRATFLEKNGTELLWMGAFVLIVVPLVHLVWELLFHQSFVGSFAMMIRWRAHRQLLGQSLAFFQDDMAGRVANTVMQTALAIREALNKLFDVMVYFSVYVLSSIVLMVSADWRLALPMAAWVAGYGVAMAYFIPRLGAVAQEQADTRSVMTGRIVDSYTNIQTVKLFAHSHAETAYARASMEPFLGTVNRQMRIVTALNMTLLMLNLLLLSSVVGLSIMLWLRDAATVGAVAVAIGLVLRLQGMSQWILWEMAALFEAIGTMRDGAETLSKPIGMVDAPGAATLQVKQGEIAFDRVCFGYGKMTYAIEDLSLRIAPGEKVGIVGRSGAGKSTLTTLLLRLHDIQSGRILIDGQDIAAVTQDSLRAKVGLVTQDTALMHRSIADNIRYGRADASDAQVEDAAQAAQAHDFILRLSDGKGRRGYDAHVGERGIKLSGGQRQRIAMARVFLKDAPIIVLDEATSALDSEVEAAIQDNLDRLTRNKTVLAIAHRLSTIARMDRLIVMDAGRIVQEGTHAELIANGGIYADLWARQSGGFIGAGFEPALA